MAVNSAFANGFGGGPMVGLLGSWPPDPAQSSPQSLLPTPPTPLPTVGVLGLPGDLTSLIAPPYNPYQLAGADPQTGGDLAVMGAQMRALRAIRDHLDVAAGWLQSPGQGQAAETADSPSPVAQPPLQAAITPGAGVTPAPTMNASAFAGSDPNKQLKLDPSYTVQPGDNLSSIAGRYLASGLFPDLTTGVGALTRRNGLSSSRLMPGQALTVPLSAEPEDPRLGRAMIAGDARVAAVRALTSETARKVNPAFIPGIPVGRANETWSASNNADSMYGPGPTYDWSAETGINPNAQPGPDWRATTRHLLGEMFAPEVNAYEYGIVQPFWNGLSVLANSPLGDAGTYETIQSAGPPGAIIGGGLGLAAKGLDRLAELGADAEAAEAEAQGIQLVAGRPPINSKLAGQVHPLDKRPDVKALYPDSVRFTDAGFPDFWPYQKVWYKSDHLTFDPAKDRALANESAGFSKAPEGYVWHHVEDGKTMLLIPKDLHEAIGHTGGRAVNKYLKDVS